MKLHDEWAIHEGHKILTSVVVFLRDKEAVGNNLLRAVAEAISLQVD